MDPNNGVTQGDFDTIFKKVQEGNQGPVLSVIAQSLDEIDKTIKETMLSIFKANLKSFDFTNKEYFLLYASGGNYVELAEALLSSPEIKLHEKIPNTPYTLWLYCFELAFREGHTGIINAILQAPNMYEGLRLQEGESILHFAVKYSHINKARSLEIINFLKKEEANPNITEDGKSPLMLAIESRDIAVINALLEFNAIDICDNAKKTIVDLLDSEITKEQKTMAQDLLKTEPKVPKRTISSMFRNRNATTDSMFYKILTAYLHSTKEKNDDKKKFFKLAKKIYKYKIERDKMMGRPQTHSKLIEKTIQLIDLTIKGDMSDQDAYNELTAKIESTEKYTDLRGSEEFDNFGTKNPLLKFQEETDPPITEPTNGNRAPKIN